MQFRSRTYRDKDGNIKQGQTIQLMRYSYDPVNKRGRQVMIGSFKVDDPRLPPEVEALLTPQEKAEFKEWKRAQQRAVAHEKLAAVLDTLDDVMTRSCMALDVGAGTVKDPARIWDLIDALERSMTRAGHERPPRPRGRPAYKVLYDLSAMTDDEAEDYKALDPEGYEESLKHSLEDEKQKLASLPDFTPPEKKKAPQGGA
jgi:hypothetical protein